MPAIFAAAVGPAITWTAAILGWAVALWFFAYGTVATNSGDAEHTFSSVATQLGADREAAIKTNDSRSPDAPPVH
jgi:uncharacterized membrane protein